MTTESTDVHGQEKDGVFTADFADNAEIKAMTTEEWVCEKCKKEAATVHITSVVDGKTVTEDLCASCAEPRLNSMPGESAGWTSYNPLQNSADN